MMYILLEVLEAQTGVLDMSNFQPLGGAVELVLPAFLLRDESCSQVLRWS